MCSVGAALAAGESAERRLKPPLPKTCAEVLERPVGAGFAAEVDSGAVIDFEAGGGGRSDPVEIAEAPEVGESDQQDAEEEEHIDDGDFADVEDGLAELGGQFAGAAEGDGPGIEEGDFDVEDEEDQGDDVEAEVE